MSKSESILSPLRETFSEASTAGNLRDVIKKAEETIKDHPASAASYIIKGDAEIKLGHVNVAHETYSNALKIYNKRYEGKREGIFPRDILITEEKLINTDVLNGNFKDARTRAKRLAEAGESKWIELLRRDYSETTRLAQEAFDKGEYVQAEKFAQEFLIKRGDGDYHMELLYTNSIILKDSAPNQLGTNLRVGLGMARRLAFFYPEESFAYSTLGMCRDLIQKNNKLVQEVFEGSPMSKVLYESDLVNVATYRKALELDPTNGLANERFKQLMGKPYTEHISKYKGAVYEGSKNVVVSSRLEQDPQVIFEEKQEILWYWNQHTKEYRRAIDRLDSEIGAPMHPLCRIAVCIPSFMEEKNIYRTLLQYTKQEGVSPEKFEVIILENHKVGYDRDDTASEIAKFEKDFPDIKVRHVYTQFEGNEAVMGHIRKVSFDLAIRRRMKSEGLGNGGGLILASNDADFYGMKNRAFSYLLNRFDTDPQLDLMAGKWDYPREFMKEFPTIHHLLRFVRTYSAMSARYYGNGRVISSGACSYFRASTYAGIGGYEWTVKRGSDTELGLRIGVHRKEQSSKRMKQTNALRIYTDPRRSLSKMVIGKSWVDQWEDTDWQEDTNVFGKNWSEFKEPTLKKLDLRRLEWEMNRFLENKLKSISKRPKIRSSQREMHIIKRACGLLGIDYRLNLEGKDVPRRFDNGYEKGSGIFVLDNVVEASYE